ncbi:MAG: iron ABC transporter permease [Clostridia bacterium]
MLYKSRKMSILIYISLAALLFLAVMFSSGLGSADIGFFRSLRILVSGIPFLDRLFDFSDIQQTHRVILFSVRLPRIVTAMLCGAGLSISGSVFQGMFRNPMADPYVLGISSGAALGASLAISLGLQVSLFGFGIIPLFALAGAVAVTMTVYGIARTAGKLAPLTLILSGIAVSFLCSSLVSFILISNREQAHKIVFWTMGSMTGANWNNVLVMLPVVLIGSFLLIWQSGNINVLSTGDESALSLGINTERLKRTLLLLGSVITAVCVAFTGIIGFVGLIIPHGVRLVTGPDHRRLMPVSALTGAIFLVLCDALARNVFAPMEIPIGAVTSLFGAPFFIYLLMKNKRRTFL